MPGAQPHPQPRMQNGKKHTSVVTTGRRNITAFPAQWLERLLRALPGEAGFFATVAARIVFTQLDSSVAETGPHGLTVRARAARLATQRVHRIPRQRIVTIAKRPSCGRDGAVRSRFPNFGNRNIFAKHA